MSLIPYDQHQPIVLNKYWHIPNGSRHLRGQSLLDPEGTPCTHFHFFKQLTYSSSFLHENETEEKSFVGHF